MKHFYIWLMVCAIAGLAACSAPVIRGDSHAVWLEHVRNRGW